MSQARRKTVDWLLRRIGHGTTAVSLATALLVVTAAELGGQQPYTVYGRVVSADSSPLAMVRLVVLGATGQAQTTANGGFRLHLMLGTWKVELRRLGFQPDTTEFQVPRDAAGEIVITLRPAAASLPLLNVTGDAERPFTSIAPGESVRRLPSLAEPDVFRAVTLLPGVSAPNDFRGTINLAGGSGDETGVTLDGHPLAEPFHLAGLLGAFNVEALEDASVHIGVLPTDYTGRLGGLIQLTSRQPQRTREGQARLGVLSGGFTVLTAQRQSSPDVLVSVRSSYLDQVAERIVQHTGGSDLLLPGYRDALFRAGISWRGNARTEWLTFVTRDSRRSSSASSQVASPELTTGEQLAGLRHRQTLGHLTVHARVSANRSTASQSGELSFNPMVRNTHDWLSGLVSASRLTSAGTLEAGFNADAHSAHFRWSDIDQATFAVGVPPTYAGSQSQRQLGTFVRWSAPDAASFVPSVGLRATTVGNGVYLAPRASLVVRNRSSLEWRAALERRQQFETELGTSVEGSLPSPRIFLNSPREVDAASVQATLRRQALNRSFHLTATVEAFARRYRNRSALLASPIDPATGEAALFPTFERIKGTARGASIAGVATLLSASLQLAYTYNNVWETRDGERSPPDWNVRQQLAATASVAVGGAWHLTGVAQAHDGAVITPVIAHSFGTPSSADIRQSVLSPRYFYGPRNSGRLASFSRLDLAARREWQARRSAWSLSIMALNVLNKHNPLAYDWTTYFCVRAGECESAQSRSGLPFLPSISVDVRW